MEVGSELVRMERAPAKARLCLSEKHKEAHRVE
jgi:hypothetical protein